VFCKNSEFIETGETLGLKKRLLVILFCHELRDIRSEKEELNRWMPTSQKKGLLVQKTSLDPSFEFRKLGTPIKENEKLIPTNY
jgi:hypothetical protein